MPEADQMIENVAEKLLAFGSIRTESEEQLLQRRDEILHDILRDFGRLPSRQVPAVLAAVLERVPRRNLCREVLLARYAQAAGAFFGAQRETLAGIARELRQDSNELRQQYLTARIEAIADLWRLVARPLLRNGAADARKQTAGFAEELKSLCVRFQNEGLPSALAISRAQQRVTEEIKAEREETPQAAEETLHIRALRQNGLESLASIQMTRGVAGGAANRLLLMDDALAWNNAVYRTADISAFTWISEILHENGRPSGVHYRVRIQTNHGDQAEINPATPSEYNALVSFLWKNAGKRLLEAWLARLRKGETLRIGNLDFDDRGANLTHYGWLDKKPRHFPWQNIALEARAGGFALRAEGDYTAVFSYDTTFNARILEHLVQQYQASGEEHELSKAFPADT